MIREVCVEGYLEAINGEKNGAERIELCDNLEVGGTTPSYGTIKKTIESVKIPVFVIIRPRGGNFCYSLEEIEIMKNDILICKNLNVSGVVLGALDKNNNIDYPLIKEFVTLAKPMSVTFHKAIDEVKNPVLEVKKLANIGVDRILTSGTKATAIEGKDIINEMIVQSKNQIKIVVAGKVTKENLENIKKLIPNEEYHGKKIV